MRPEPKTVPPFRPAQLGLLVERAEALAAGGLLTAERFAAACAYVAPEAFAAEPGLAYALWRRATGATPEPWDRGLLRGLGALVRLRLPLKSRIRRRGSEEGGGKGYAPSAAPAQPPEAQLLQPPST